VRDERRARLRGKHLELGAGELVAAAVSAAVAVVVLIVMPRLEDSRVDLALWAALTPLLVTLVQAGAYWLLART
jgi:hypothetical protein